MSVQSPLPGRFPLSADRASPSSARFSLRPSAGGRWGGGWLAGRLLDVLAGGLLMGELTVDLPDGGHRVYRGRSAGPQAAIRLHRARALRRMAMGGAIGVAESYMDGDWDSPDITALLELGDRNDQALDGCRGHALARWAAWARHRLNDNSRRGSRRNIQAHYDLGNDFYQAWLDPGMTYSAALFAPDVPPDDLEQAQYAKYRALARDLDLRPGMRVLEIGCGWGGFARLAAREFGTRVVGITLSREQHAYARARVAAEGLADQVEIRLQDYRDVPGRFDAIASIEMIEAVGERWWPTYFATLHDRLRDGGRAAVQAITITPDRFDGYRRGCDFIQRHVFPGGMLPSEPVMAARAAAAGLDFHVTRRFGGDYERTLALWDRRFQAAWPDIHRLGYPPRFKRLWEFYLAYCRAGFRTGTIDVCHAVMQRR